MPRQTTVKTPPRTGSVAAGAEAKKGELKKTGVRTRETNIKTLPQATIAAGGRDIKKGEHQHEMEWWHDPQFHEGGKSVPRGGEVPS